MKKRLIIKFCKGRQKSRVNYSRYIVVGYNNMKANGGYVDKIGVKYNDGSAVMVVLNTKKLGYWLNRGAKIKTKISQFLGLLALPYYSYEMYLSWEHKLSYWGIGKYFGEFEKIPDNVLNILIKDKLFMSYYSQTYEAKLTSLINIDSVRDCISDLDQFNLNFVSYDKK